MARQLTNFDLMWRAYPGPAAGADEVKALIGGALNAPWVTNTCVIRLSRCFNYAGHPIPRNAPGLSTAQGADGMSYAFRLREFRRYLGRVYGAPAVTHTSSSPGPEVPAPLRGRQGVIVFVVEGWTDATGHMDLWDGSRPRHRAYFEKANLVELWPASDLAESPARELAGLPPLSIVDSVGAGGRNRAPDVVNVQVLLRENGLGGQLIDGKSGPVTIAAIKEFQARAGIAPDGRVDPGGRTLRALNARQ